MKFELLDGRIVEAKKDCSCSDHEGPHWVYANELWKRRNDELRAVALDPTLEPQRRYFAIQGLAMEERARLVDKLNCMQSAGINRIIAAEAIRDFQTV